MRERLIPGISAAILGAAGLTVLVTVAIVWSGCQSGMYSDTCVAAMSDGDPVLAGLYAWGVGFVIAIITFARKSTRWGGMLAIVILLIANPLADLALFQAISPIVSGESAWDAPVLSGLLVGAALVASAIVIFARTPRRRVAPAVSVA